MTIEEILYSLHNSRESELLPLSNIKSEQDKKYYAAQGYPVPCTYSEWKKKYPRIDADCIVLMGGFHFDIAYYEKESLLFLHLPILVLEEDTDEALEYENKIVCMIQKTRSEITNGTANYSMLLETYPDGIRIDGLEQLLNLIGPGETFFRTFVSVYVSSDFKAQNLPRSIVDALIASKSDEQKRETEIRLMERFGNTNTYTAYRGMTEKSSTTETGLSWTPNINLAYRFATVLGDTHIVAQAEIQKEDIIEYISPSMKPEEEFIVEPGAVSVQKMTVLPSPDSSEVNDFVDMILPTYQTYRNKLKRLYKKYDSGSFDHDALHSLRVLLLSLVLAASKGLSKAECKQLASAAIYHDIGRVDDRADMSHGEKSAEIYRKDDGKDDTVAFLIQYHCIEDNIAKEKLTTVFPVAQQEKVLGMYSIIKDADALDRLRFGFAIRDGSDGLDVRYLRNDYAKKLVAFAHECKKGLRL